MINQFVRIFLPHFFILFYFYFYVLKIFLLGESIYFFPLQRLPFFSLLKLLNMKSLVLD